MRKFFFVLFLLVCVPFMFLPAQAAFKPLPVVITSLPAGTRTQSHTVVAQTAPARKAQKRVQRLLKSRLFQKLFRPGGGFARNQIIAFILALVLGGLGAHRFYLGYIPEGILQLLLVAGPLVLLAVLLPLSVALESILLILLLGGMASLASIWVLVDIIRIATGKLKPKNSDYDTTF